MSGRGNTLLSRIVKSNRRKSLDDITSIFNESCPRAVSRRTIQRKLHELGYSRRRVAKTLGVREYNKKRRCGWCKERLLWTVNRQWKNIIFSDEMTIVIKLDGKIYVWRKPEEKWHGICLGYLSGGPGRTLKLMVWGTMTYYGMGILKFVEGNMDSRKYIDTLDNCLWPVITKYMADKPWRYMDDNAPCHRAREVETWREENNIPRFPWPAQSPDLNPIENIWLVLKNSVKRNILTIRTLNDLREHLQSAWENIPLVFIQGLYQTLPKRCRQVILSKGNITKY